MRNRARLLVVLVCVMMGIAFWVILIRSSEPAYKGKSLSRWVQICVVQNPPESDEAKEAIRQIGPNAVPWLSALIRSPEQNRKSILARAVEVLPEKLRPAGLDIRSPQPEFVISAFGALGPAAQSAIPELTRMANEPSISNGAFYSAMALANLGKEGFQPLLALLTNQNENLCYRGVCGMRYAGSNALPAIPWLMRCLNNPGDLLIERSAAQSLGELALEPNVVLPALSNRLHHSQQYIRYEAVRDVASFAEKDHLAVPVLVVALSDSDPSVRMCATNALLKIAPETLTNVPPH